QRHSVGAAGAFGRIRISVVPGAVLQGHGEDVGDRVVQSLAGGSGLVLLRVVGSGADRIVGVVAGPDDDCFDVVRVGGIGMLAVQIRGQVDPGLRLVLGRVLLGVGVQDGSVGVTGLRQGVLVASIGAVEHPCDHAVFALVDR